MGGGSGARRASDDFRIQPGERIWRLVSPDWYQQGKLMEAIFIDEVSVLRADHGVSEQIIDAMPNARFGSFACYGILELSADDIRNAGCVFEITQEAWPPDSHAILRRRDTGGKTFRATHPEAIRLIDLANRSLPLVRNPR